MGIKGEIMNALIKTDLPGLTRSHQGKVRDIYTIENDLLIVATDRISAFDSVFPTGIPGKGIILTKISNKWFSLMNFVENHLIETDVENFPKILQPFKDQLKDRAVLVKKAKRIDFECVVRGYLAGSGWKEYKKQGTVCGEELPEGLQEGEKLPFAIFTPATKADSGHDENVPFSVMVTALGKDLAEELRRKSIQLYEKAHSYLEKNNIILADTKFEFGLNEKDEVILIDELLTPDSSRFWPGETYKIGQTPPGFDKQYVRDYVEQAGWDKNPPAPVLPDSVVEKTLEKYKQAEKLILSI